MPAGPLARGGIDAPLPRRSRLAPRGPAHAQRARGRGDGFGDAGEPRLRGRRGRRCEPSGWKSAGDAGADFTEAGGNDSDFRLTDWSADDYAVETTQKLTGIENGWYTLRATIRRSAGGGDVWIGLEKCGGDARASVPVSTGQWLEIVVSAQVKRNSCTIVLGSDVPGGEWAHFDDIAIEPGRAALSVLGADVSSLFKSERLGGVYRTARGRERDALRILKDNGLNWIRLRVFVDPADGYHGTRELLAMALRAKRLGIKVLVDLHYSDFWADPGKQWTPEAWEGLSFDDLKARFVRYTRRVMRALERQGTPPAMVQLGNEINRSGMLWDHAATWTGCSTADEGYPGGATKTVCHTEDWDALAELLTAGYRVVKRESARTRVMLHLDAGGDNGTYRWWFDNITSRDVPFDVIGASYYGYWHGTLAQLQANLDDITARYDKDVVVVETAYAFTLEDDDGWPNIIGTEAPWCPATRRPLRARRHNCAT